MNSWVKRWLFIGIFTLLSFVGRSEAVTPKKVLTVEGIEEYRLANGLSVLLFADPTKSTITVNITYFVGSRHEGYGESGMAHLLEHMLFKGTPEHPLIWKELSDRGAAFNGTTWLDRTNYYETLSASKENLEFALRLDADRMVNSFIAKKDLDSEMTVVRNEFEMGENNPVNILSQRVTATAFLWHNYGKSTIGSREDIERVSVENLKAFYQKYYQPDQAMLVVTGNFEKGWTLERIQDIFGSIPKPERKLGETYTVEPEQDGEREVLLRRVGDIQAIDLNYHICPGSHPDMAALEVLTHILTATETGRLYRALVESQLATQVWATPFRLREAGFMEMGAVVRLDKSLDEVKKVMVGVLDGISGEPISLEEVARAKNHFAKDFDLLLSDSTRVGLSLTDSAAAGDWRLLFLHRDRVRKVTPQDVMRVAKTYLKPNNRTLGLFTPTSVPDRTIVPEAPILATVLKNYKGEKALAAGEIFLATPENIESRLLRFETSFGMKGAMLAKKTRGESVNATLVFRFGSEGDFKGRLESISALVPMLMRGTANLTRRQIEDRLDELKASLTIGGGVGAIVVTIQTTRKHLPAVLELTGKLLKESNFPEKEFVKLQKAQMADIEQRLSEPADLARLSLDRKLTNYPPDNIRYVPTFEERLARMKALSLPEVKAAYADFLGAEYSQVAIVGDFDPSMVRKKLEQEFSGWKNKKRYSRIPMPYRQVKAEKAEIKTPDRANALYNLGKNILLRDDDPQYPALLLANYVLGANANSRFTNRLRQKEGLSYRVGSSIYASPYEPSGQFVASGISAPENVGKAVKLLHEEIESFRKNGLTQKELDEARASYLEKVKMGLSQDAALAATLAGDLHLNRTLEFTMERIAQIEALTPADLEKAAQKFMEPKDFVLVKAGDFK